MNKKNNIFNMFFYVYVVSMFLFICFSQTLSGTQNDGELKIEPASEELSDVNSAITNKLDYSKKELGLTEEEKFARYRVGQIMESPSWVEWEAKRPKFTRENIQGTILVVAVVSTTILVTVAILEKAELPEKLI